MFKKTYALIYHVNNNAAKERYTKVTGIKSYFDKHFYASFDINGFELGHNLDNTNFSPGNTSVTYWAIDDVSSILSKLVSLDTTTIQPKTNIGSLLEASIAEDPFGEPDWSYRKCLRHLLFANNMFLAPFFLII